MRFRRLKITETRLNIAPLQIAAGTCGGLDKLPTQNFILSTHHFPICRHVTTPKKRIRFNKSR
jgi:hypothetical protein